jgi:Cys-tRNA(Pro) deacylase
VGLRPFLSILDAGLRRHDGAFSAFPFNLQSYAFSLYPFILAFSHPRHYIAGMAKEKIPSTPAVLVLKKSAATFTLQTYAYEEHGGTKVSSRKLGVDEHCVIKTLVMEDENANPFMILMHGDREVSTKALARALGVKTVRPCTPETAHRHTGYFVGGTSPFGAKKDLKLYMEKTISGLPEIFINAGSRGLLARMPPSELVRILNPFEVSVAI